jgi:hypothetical protein
LGLAFLKVILIDPTTLLIKVKEQVVIKELIGVQLV